MPATTGRLLFCFRFLVFNQPGRARTCILLIIYKKCVVLLDGDIPAYLIIIYTFIYCHPIYRVFVLRELLSPGHVNYLAPVSREPDEPRRCAEQRATALERKLTLNMSYFPNRQCTRSGQLRSIFARKTKGK